MNVLIVEDEAPAARRLEKLLRETAPDARIAGHTESIGATVNWLQCNPEPDLVMLDIQLGDGLSFDIYNSYPLRAPVIFTTAYDEYALRAFKVNSIDYLLKPIDPAELRAAIDKMRISHPGDRSALIRELFRDYGKSRYKERFLVSKGAEMLPVDVNTVAYFHYEDRYVFLHTHDGKRYITEHTLDELEKQLDPARFFRANRQFIVSVNAVRSAQHGFNGKLKAFVFPVPPEELVVSRERAGAFKEWLGNG